MSNNYFDFVETLDPSKYNIVVTYRVTICGQELRKYQKTYSINTYDPKQARQQFENLSCFITRSADRLAESIGFEPV